MSKTAAVIAAAGSSSRAGGKDKLFETLGGVPILVHSVAAMCKSLMIDSIVIVTRADKIELVSSLCNQCCEQRNCKPILVVAGGESRAESVLKGISALMEKHGDEYGYVAIHDGARPFVKPELINRVVAEAVKSGAAIPAVSVSDTIKRVHGGFVVDTPPRNELYAAQTPQVFSLPLYLSAARESSEDITDDSLLFEKAGIPVRIVDGDYGNIKITTPGDFALAKEIYDAENKICSE